MNEFEGICKKYVGIGRNIQGLHEAAKSHLTKAVSSWVDASHLGYTKAQLNCPYSIYFHRFKKNFFLC
jgi:hypothetical protein